LATPSRIARIHRALPINNARLLFSLSKTPTDIQFSLVRRRARAFRLRLSAPKGAGDERKMKTLLLTISLALVTAAPAIAQTTDTRGNASAGNSSSISKQGRQVDLQSNTQLAAQLENSLDARHAKVGDRVALKTTQAVKQNGAVVVPKGSRLLGHVTDVQQRTKNDNESVIGIAFDRLQKGSMEIPITATGPG
jgi:hypothetical protein